MGRDRIRHHKWQERASCRLKATRRRERSRAVGQRCQAQRTSAIREDCTGWKLDAMPQEAVLHGARRWIRRSMVQILPAQAAAIWLSPCLGRIVRARVGRGWRPRWGMVEGGGGTANRLSEP